MLSAILSLFAWGCRDVTGGATVARRLWGLAKVVVIVLALLAVGGAIGAASGVIPIAASSGHWPITEWFLKFSMSRSVATHSIGIEAPPLDDPRLVLMGAGHYETACRSCHGSPALHHPRVAAAMTPHPPYLPPRVGTWDPEELFYIVKHGVKFTGMPAWPAKHRDDEIWAMTAFLLEFPKLDPDGYRQLVFGDTLANGIEEEGTPDEDAPMRAMLGPDSVPRNVLDNCRRCHGRDGRGRGIGAFPKLAGQQSEYLVQALEAYAAGDRPSGVMEPIAAALEPDTIAALAEHFSGLDPSGRTEIRDTETRSRTDDALERGRLIAKDGLPRRRVPACSDCHGSSGESQNSAYPSLDGQFAPYLVNQLKLFQQGRRGGSKHAHLMDHVAPHLTSEQMHDVAAYYESLPITGNTAPTTPE
ncbi:MAG: c-type cytochrome [Planctomycetaceae bacterium]|nr:c-type cytochrome [Planctomycetaceae bacterium]